MSDRIDVSATALESQAELTRVSPVRERSGGYTSVEAALLRENLPKDLGGLSDSEITAALSVDGKPLPALAILSAHLLFESSPSEYVGWVNDKETFDGLLKDIRLFSKEEKTRIWYAIAALPFSSTQSDKLLEALGTGFSLAERCDTEEQEISIRKLPARHLPQLSTFLSNVETAAIEPAAASLMFTSVGGEERELKLSTEHTAYLLFHAEEALHHLKETKSETDEEYNQMMLKPLQTVLALLGEQIRSDTNPTVMFRQYAQGGRGVVTKMNDLEVRELRDLLSHTNGYSDKEFPTAPPIPAIIHLSGVSGELDLNSPQFSDPSQETPVGRWRDETTLRDPQSRNDWERSYLKVTQATKTGHWTPEVFDLYMKYLDCMPQHLEHLLGALDVTRRVENGQIEGEIKRVASIASGPHEEYRAQLQVSTILNGKYVVPEVWSLDSSKAGLEISRDNLPEASKGGGKDVVADMTEAPSSVPRRSFDMVECSSFDNLKTNDALARSISNMASLVRPGGVLRFAHGSRFTQEAMNSLKSFGFTPLEENKKFKLHDQAKERIRDNHGDEVLKRCQDKLNRHLYTLLKVPQSVDEKALREVLVTSEIFSPPIRNSHAQAARAFRKEATLSYDKLFGLCVTPRRALDTGRLNEAHLSSALKMITGSLDMAGARKIYERYFTGRYHKGVSRVAHDALGAVASQPEARKILECGLLRHENKKVGDLWLEIAKEEPRAFMTRLLAVITEGGDTAPYEKAVSVLSESCGGVEAIEEWFKSHSKSPTFEATAHLLHQIVPEGVRFVMPVSLRWNPVIGELYHARCVDYRWQDLLSPSELTRFLCEQDASAPSPQGLKIAIDSALSLGDKAMAEEVSRFIMGSVEVNSPSEEIVTIARESWGALMKITSGNDFEKTIKLRKFGFERLGVSLPGPIGSRAGETATPGEELARKIQALFHDYTSRSGHNYPARLIAHLDEAIYGYNMTRSDVSAVVSKQLRAFNFKDDFVEGNVTRWVGECMDRLRAREVERFKRCGHLMKAEDVLSVMQGVTIEEHDSVRDALEDFIKHNGAQLDSDWFRNIPRGLLEMVSTETIVGQIAPRAAERSFEAVFDVLSPEQQRAVGRGVFGELEAERISPQSVCEQEALRDRIEKIVEGDLDNGVYECSSGDELLKRVEIMCALWFDEALVHRVVRNVESAGRVDIQDLRTAFVAPFMEAMPIKELKTGLFDPTSTLWRKSVLPIVDYMFIKYAELTPQWYGMLPPIIENCILRSYLPTEGCKRRNFPRVFHTLGEEQKEIVRQQLLIELRENRLTMDQLRKNNPVVVDRAVKQEG